MSSSHDSRRASQGGTLGIGHDPRRGASSPQWNREPPQMAQQFQRRHASPYDSPYGRPYDGSGRAYDSPYGGQFGGYENSREPQPVQKRRPWNSPVAPEYSNWAAGQIP